MVLMLCFLCSGLTFQLTSNNLNLYLRHSLDLADQFQFIVSSTHTLLSFSIICPCPLSSLPRLSAYHLCPFLSSVLSPLVYMSFGWMLPTIVDGTLHALCLCHRLN
eukprot:COSAG06_NODE_21871_length_742_cov_1.412131_1_plen_106_part_00